MPTVTLRGTVMRKVTLTTCIHFCPKCGDKAKVTKRYRKPKKEALKLFHADLVKSGWTPSGKDLKCPMHKEFVMNVPIEP